MRNVIEQGLWDIVGKARCPVHVLLGGAVRTEILAYANINLITTDRSPAGFARSAAQARDAGFSIVKAVSFGGFPAPADGVEMARRATDLGVDCLLAMRDAPGSDASIRVDCHRYFEFGRAVDIARRLEPARLDWYEEPINPADVVTTARTKASIPQRVAGGEQLFGVAGFAPLCRLDVIDVVMPDVTHGGGILEAHHIAALAAGGSVGVPPQRMWSRSDGGGRTVPSRHRQLRRSRTPMGPGAMAGRSHRSSPNR